MSEREKIILSAVGGIVTLVLGYLIWRHEENITAQNNANTVAANQQIADQQAQQLTDALSAIPVGGASFNYASPSDYSSGNFGSTSTAASPVDNNIAAILSAFYPTQPVAQNPTPTEPTSPTPVSTLPSPIPINGGPVAIVKTLPTRVSLPQQITTMVQ